MNFIAGGTRVEKGHYFSARSWTLTPVASDGALLPGASEERYLKVPLVAAFALAPLMGAAFLMFLPLIGFYLAAGAVVRPVARLFQRSATEVAATMSPPWVPGEAHLAGKPPEEGSAAGDASGAPAGEAPRDAHLDELQKDIEARRK